MGKECHIICTLSRKRYVVYLLLTINLFAPGQGNDSC